MIATLYTLESKILMYNMTVSLLESSLYLAVLLCVILLPFLGDEQKDA